MRGERVKDAIRKQGKEGRNPSRKHWAPEEKENRGARNQGETGSRNGRKITHWPEAWLYMGPCPTSVPTSEATV